jgi:hypothetical protein
MGIRSVIPYSPKINNSTVTAKVTVADYIVIQSISSNSNINNAAPFAALFFLPYTTLHNHKNLL